MVGLVESLLTGRQGRLCGTNGVLSQNRKLLVDHLGARNRVPDSEETGCTQTAIATLVVEELDDHDLTVRITSPGCLGVAMNVVVKTGDGLPRRIRLAFFAQAFPRFQRPDDDLRIAHEVVFHECFQHPGDSLRIAGEDSPR